MTKARKATPDAKATASTAAVVLSTKGKAAAEAEAVSNFKAIGGSDSVRFNTLLLREVLGTAWYPNHEKGSELEQEDGRSARCAATAVAMRAFKLEDEIEAMIAAQAVAMHFGSMECFRRAMIHEQPADMSTKLRKDGANLARGMTDMLAALDRKRGKGPQVIRVERMVVQDGGQAVVGNVQAGSAVLPAPEPKAIGHQVEDITLDGIAAPSLAPARGRGGEKAKRRGRTP